MSNMQKELEQRLTQLEAERAIRDRCLEYCCALDRVDEKLLRSVFHEDSTHEHGPFKGLSAQFCDYALETVRALDWTQHFLANTKIELQGDVAHVESYFLAFHRLNKDKPGHGFFSEHDLAVGEDIFFGGRYVDRFECRNGAWKIAHRCGINDWNSWAPMDPRCFQLPSKRD